MDKEFSKIKLVFSDSSNPVQKKIKRPADDTGDTTKTLEIPVTPSPSQAKPEAEGAIQLAGLKTQLKTLQTVQARFKFLLKELEQIS